MSSLYANFELLNYELGTGDNFRENPYNFLMKL